MKKLKTGIIIGMINLVISLSVCANTGEIKVLPDFSSDILVIEGEANASEQITIMVFEDGTTPQNYLNKISSDNIENTIAYGDNKTFETVIYNTKDTVYYIDDTEADATGKFSQTIKLKKTDVYDVYLLYSDSGELKLIDNVNFIVSNEYGTKIDTLNSLDRASFINEVAKSESAKLFCFEDNLNSTVTYTEVAEILYQSKPDGNLKNNYIENEMLYRASVAIATLNKGETTDFSYLDYVFSKNKDLSDFIEKYKDDKQKISEYLKNKNIKNTDELNKRLEEIALLLIVENPDGYENIKNAFNSFKNATGICSPTLNNRVYSTLAGNKYNNIDELVSAYNRACESAVNGSSSSGESSGGGGGGGSSNTSGKLDIHAVQPSLTENETAETINKNIFNDLDSVTWAQEAIVNLAAKGVINGKGDYIFAPNDAITREEFTKLVVAALANDETPANISFTDVDSTSWSYIYIAKAKNAGIINGYSDILFGAKDLITRQDMSVIIYNAAKYKNLKLENANNALEFADNNEISDYAKEAVYTLRKMEIVNGTDTMRFEPKSYATRAQAAVMLYRLLLK